MLLYIMPTYLVLLTALLNAVHLYNAYLFLAIDFSKCFLLSCFVFGLLTLRVNLSVKLLETKLGNFVDMIVCLSFLIG